MEHTDEQKAGFKQEYAVLRRNQLMVSVPLIVVVFAVAYTRDNQAETLLGLPPNIAAFAFLALVLGALVFSFKNWRCPACDNHLRGMNPRHCQSCRVALRG